MILLGNEQNKKFMWPRHTQSFLSSHPIKEKILADIFKLLVCPTNSPKPKEFSILSQKTEKTSKYSHLRW